MPAPSTSQPRPAAGAERPATADAPDHFLKMMLFQPRGLAKPRRRGEAPALPRAPEYGPLPQSRLSGSSSYHVADPGMARVGLASPAFEVMTDLNRAAAVTISRFAFLHEAKRTMISRGVRSLFVVDGSRLLGLVTANDIHGERPMLVGQEHGLRHEEILVRDIMTPADNLEAIDLAAVLAARVGDVLETLKRAGRQHALVVDRGSPGRERVRGLFSLSQIARQLGVTPSTPEVGRTFAEIEAALAA